MATRSTRYAGVGWRGGWYCAVVLDGQGVSAEAAAALKTSRITELLGFLQRFRAPGGALVCVIDTTSGVLERHLVEAGFALYRADPWVIGPGCAGRSADIRQLALLGREQTASLTRLTLADGGLSGRDAEVEIAVRAGAPIERMLAGRDRFFEHGPDRCLQVALTFDDGPSERFTAQVLDVLAGFGAVATFFCVGMNVQHRPDLAERAAAEGHVLANHTWSHPYLPDLAPEDLNWQLARTNEVVARITGKSPTLFRPPYGGRDAAVMRRLALSGMTTVLWDVEAPDWRLPGEEEIGAEILGNVRNGSVILLHDGGGDRSQTVRSLPRILEGLSQRGYRFVTIENLIRTAAGTVPA